MKYLILFFLLSTNVFAAPILDVETYKSISENLLQKKFSGAIKSIDGIYFLDGASRFNNEKEAIDISSVFYVATLKPELLPRDKDFSNLKVAVRAGLRNPPLEIIYFKENEDFPPTIYNSSEFLLSLAPNLDSDEIQRFISLLQKNYPKLSVTLLENIRMLVVKTISPQHSLPVEVFLVFKNYPQVKSVFLNEVIHQSPTRIKPLKKIERKDSFIDLDDYRTFTKKLMENGIEFVGTLGINLSLILGDPTEF